MGLRIIQDSAYFKQQRTRKKRHWKEVQDHQDFEMGSKHLMISLERGLELESADNEDYKQQGTYKKRKSKEAHLITSLGILYFKILKAPSNTERYSWYGIKLI